MSFIQSYLATRAAPIQNAFSFRISVDETTHPKVPCVLSMKIYHVSYLLKFYLSIFFPALYTRILAVELYTWTGENILLSGTALHNDIEKRRTLVVLSIGTYLHTTLEMNITLKTWPTQDKASKHSFGIFVLVISKAHRYFLPSLTTGSQNVYLTGCCIMEDILRVCELASLISTICSHTVILLATIMNYIPIEVSIGGKFRSRK